MAERPTTDLAVLVEHTAPAGKDVLDVGCGPGGLVRELAARGARVTGLEVSEAQLGGARERDPAGRYVIGRAEALPLPDAGLDLVVFMRSLHHVPIEAMAAALAESCRVLRPGGLLYVAEPLPEGSYFELTSLVEDELQVRRAAQEALGAASDAGLERVRTIDYDVQGRLADVEAFRARAVAAEPERAAVLDARHDELAAAFELLGEPGDVPGERVFIQPMQADVLRRRR